MLCLIAYFESPLRRATTALRVKGFKWSYSRLSVSIFLLQQKRQKGITELKSRCQRRCIPFRRLYGRIWSMFIWAVGRIWFLLVVELRSHLLLVVSWRLSLASRGHLCSLACGPFSSIFNTSYNGSSPSHVSNLSSFFICFISQTLLSWKRVSTFKDSHD